MLETHKSRKEFLDAMKMGRLNPQLLQKAMSEYQLFGDCDAIDIVWALAHNDPNIRQFGNAVFTICADPNRATVLIEAITRERRGAAADAFQAALTNLPQEALFAATGRMINNKLVDTRRKAMQLLISQPSWPKQRTQVMALLEDPDTSVCEAMLTEVVARAPKSYVNQLRQLAIHENAKIRELALKSIIELAEIRDAELFLERLPLEDGELRKALFEAVVAAIKSEPQTMLQVIVKAIASPQAEVSRTAMDFFVKMPDKRNAVRTFLRFADSISSMMKDQLFQQAARHGEIFVEPILDLAKNEPDPAMRLQALNLAKALKNQKLAPLFLHELKNPDWMVRYTAIQVLAAMKSQQALPVLVELLGREENAIAVIQALDHYQDVRLAKPLLAKLQQTGESEQIAILQALLNMGDGRLLSPIGQFLNSSAPKGKARLKTREIIIQLCKATQTQVPAAVMNIYDGLRERTLDDLPDLGLKMSGDY